MYGENSYLCTVTPNGVADIHRKRFRIVLSVKLRQFQDIENGGGKNASLWLVLSFLLRYTVKVKSSTLAYYIKEVEVLTD